MNYNKTLIKDDGIITTDDGKMWRRKVWQILCPKCKGRGYYGPTFEYKCILCDGERTVRSTEYEEIGSAD